MRNSSLQTINLKEWDKFMTDPTKKGAPSLAISVVTRWNSILKMINSVQCRREAFLNVLLGIAAPTAVAGDGPALGTAANVLPANRMGESRDVKANDDAEMFEYFQRSDFDLLEIIQPVRARSCTACNCARV